MRGGPSRGAPRGDLVVLSWCPLGAEGGAARQHTAVPLVLGAGTGPCGSQPVASPLFGLPPRSPARAACSWLLLSLAEPPLRAHGAPSSAPFRSLTAAMAEGERALCRSDQGTLMPEPHPPDSCPGKRILLLNSLLGVFVSTPPALLPASGCWRGPRGVQGHRARSGAVPGCWVRMCAGLAGS